MLKSIVLALAPVSLGLAYQFINSDTCEKSQDDGDFKLMTFISCHIKETIIILTGLLVFVGIILSIKQSKNKQLDRTKCSTRIPREQYESFKKKYTEDTIREYMESFEYRRYVDVKRNNRLREVELTDSDNIVLSDDSSVLGEDEKVIQRQ